MKSEPWQCPFCGNHATIGTYDTQDEVVSLHEGAHIGMTFLHYRSILCPNQECKEVSLQVEFVKADMAVPANALTQGEVVKAWSLLPESEAKPQPDCIPQSIQEDYYEACLIKDKSPKASATLARRCLQAMIRDFWQIKDKKRLHKEIEAIEEKIPPETWDAIDAVRRIGNIGAHMEQDVNLIIDVKPDEAGALIQLIEFLFQDWYVAKEERRKAQEKIIAMADQKDAQRKPPPDKPEKPEPA